MKRQRQVSAYTPDSKANMELIRPFIGKHILVKSGSLQIEGVLVDCLPSFHKALGGLIVKNGDGIHYIRCWQIIAIKGENRNERDKAISKAWNDIQICDSRRR